VASLLAVALGGCLGGDDDSNRESAYRPPIGSANEFELKESLLPDFASVAPAAKVERYEPTGEIVADSGFRPPVDGFAFENYTNDRNPHNLGPAEMAALFGEQVCLSGEGEGCELVPAAQEWMMNQNEGMAGGHCEGFSIAALRMFDGGLEEQDFGGQTTAELDIVGNEPLQGSIAQHFVYQFLPSIVDARVTGAPSEIVDALIDALESGDEHYTLGIYMPDFTGGHAITPFAVEDRGGGLYAILVYDNNFPGATRAVLVDTNAEEWQYVGGTNPKDLGQIYQGNAQTQTLELDPLRPGESEQPCPFCSGEEGLVEEGKGSVLPESEQYTEITLSGDPRNHPHLVFTDDAGNRTGIVNGKMLQEVPDVEVVKTYASRNWLGSPEPRFRLPEGRNYTITVDGSDLTRPAKPEIDLVGNGLVIEIEDLLIAPGQQDHMALPGGYGITYQTNSEKQIAPNLFAGLIEDDAAYNFAATAVGIKKGSTISMVVEQEEKVMYVDTTGSKGVLGGGKGIFILVLTKADTEGNVAQWAAQDVRLSGPLEEKAGFEYEDSPTEGKALPLVILDKNAEVKEILKAPAQKVE
jgi:hypothetical protein